jgi:hypothetical protein
MKTYELTILAWRAMVPPAWELEVLVGTLGEATDDTVQAHKAHGGWQGGASPAPTWFRATGSLELFSGDQLRATAGSPDAAIEYLEAMREHGYVKEVEGSTIESRGDS